ncbi:hypothetical protein [Snodgrassella alvi]|uniref:C-type lysozyme inhibitor domain-containing protein n=1 Tax=Snodgrassella alvi TaxID=1196083 RepID=A0A2N9X688_9NEIS|nr:hypothetical protein [Snodgrassella alvi]PIT38691.1 hypothetical protein BHC54_09255 [Snodgrassella alvi]
MKKLLLLFLFGFSFQYSFGEEFKCLLENGKTVDLKINQNTVKYAYGKPNDLELVFSMAKSKLEFYRRDADNSMLMRLPYGGVYYEFGGDNKGPFLQIKNKKGRITFKSYCAD